MDFRKVLLSYFFYLLGVVIAVVGVIKLLTEGGENWDAVKIVAVGGILVIIGIVIGTAAKKGN